MNLLPQKSWNVWNAKNRARVERDKEELRIKDEQKRKREIEIQQERRIEILKSKKAVLFENDQTDNDSLDNDNNQVARDIINDDINNGTTTITQSSTTIEQPIQRFELFKDIVNNSTNNNNNNMKKDVNNNNYNIKKKEENVIYKSPLGEGSLEFSKKTARWEQPLEDIDNPAELNTNKHRKKLKRESWTLSKEDPSTFINKVTGHKPSGTDKNSNNNNNNNQSKEVKSNDNTKKKNKSIEELRAERLAREEKERKRASELIKQKSKSTKL
ncbi:hypothetical protein PPL_04714 [Heterostelium album PN500]|uniref:CBF1-interacting co-repressor CIR N-terminal domain-containing protein n=1 Tax=Heterostelium pallidum (strain ATCC 26659 / Pp 5 / PN500) TaxID=670386 RepID=D3B8C2_HETP5|nr:hypothetical protein PPL_04714 [Heterostelium album PN500]EFA82290.1 hypothetical protein PPL_04714 [Heterostelium album PN500]|eukprot:XP_020434407.1 hypothetical protein PPL_04714 [Heterostelium album PN500]